MKENEVADKNLFRQKGRSTGCLHYVRAGQVKTPSSQLMYRGAYF